MVKDTDSPYFDAAYFILRSDLAETARESDIINEASRMIAACSKGRDVPRAVSGKRGITPLTVVSMVIAGLSVCAALLTVLL